MKGEESLERIFAQLSEENFDPFDEQLEFLNSGGCCTSYCSGPYQETGSACREHRDGVTFANNQYVMSGNSVFPLQ